MYKETTPNPLAQKFFLGTNLVDYGHHIFSSLAEVSGIAPLEDIMALPGISSVLLTPDFMTITVKAEHGSLWGLLESVIFSALEHHRCAFPLMTAELEKIREGLAHTHSAPQGAEISWQGAPPGLEEDVERLIHAYVRPGIEADGGIISVCGYSQGTLYVRLQGACSGCPHSSHTLKEGIENTLTYYLPEITRVALVEDFPLR